MNSCILNMRIVAIAVVVLLWPAVAHASKDCMTKAEARKVYRSSYLYWHGKGRCWDACRVSRTVIKKWEPYGGTRSRRRIKPKPNRSRKKSLKRSMPARCRRKPSER